MASFLSRAVARLRRAVLYESSSGTAYEIVAWANALPALAAGVAAWRASHAIGAGFAAALVAYVALRLALIHRVTVWIAAVLGTSGAAAAGGALAWLFAHAIEHPAAPPIAASIGAIAAGAAPAWAYGELVRRRMKDVRDSLVDARGDHAPSMPPSG